MKAIPLLTTIAVVAMAMTSPVKAETPDGWTPDFEAALEQAKAENKAVLVQFTGSDWCPPCMAMHKRVFSKEEFISKASEKYVLVELDFPKKKNKELAEKNQPYAEKYGVRGFPTVVLMHPDGEAFSTFTATAHPTVEAFLAYIDRQFDRKDLD